MATPSRNTAAMLLGYSRADTQDAAAQLAALKDAGCVRLFEDRASGGGGAAVRGAPGDGGPAAGGAAGRDGGG